MNISWDSIKAIIVQSTNEPKFYRWTCWYNPGQVRCLCMYACATPSAKSHVAAPTLSMCEFCKTCSFLNLPRC